MGKQNRKSKAAGKVTETLPMPNATSEAQVIILKEEPLPKEVPRPQSPEVDTPPASMNPTLAVSLPALSHPVNPTPESNPIPTPTAAVEEPEISVSSNGDMVIKMTLFDGAETCNSAGTPTASGCHRTHNSMPVEEHTFLYVPPPLSEDAPHGLEADESVWKVVTGEDAVDEASTLAAQPAAADCAVEAEEGQSDQLLGLQPYLLALSDLLNDHSPVALPLRALAVVLDRAASWSPLPRLVLALAQLWLLLVALGMQAGVALTWNTAHVYFQLAFCLPFNIAKKAVRALVSWR